MSFDLPGPLRTAFGLKIALPTANQAHATALTAHAINWLKRPKTSKYFFELFEIFQNFKNGKSGGLIDYVPFSMRIFANHIRNGLGKDVRWHAHAARACGTRMRHAHAARAILRMRSGRLFGWLVGKLFRRVLEKVFRSFARKSVRKEYSDACLCLFHIYKIYKIYNSYKIWFMVIIHIIIFVWIVRCFSNCSKTSNVFLHSGSILYKKSLFWISYSDSVYLTIWEHRLNAF